MPAVAGTLPGMATSPAGKKPAPRKSTTKKPAAQSKKAVGKVAPAQSTRNVKNNSKEAAPQLGLTPKQQRFVDEYLVDLNGTQAAIRAGYSPATARQMAAENLSKPYIELAIAEARKAQQERTHITADAMLQQAWLIATADPRELMETRVGCCRYCWGEGFKYQRTLAEFNKARERFLVDQRTGKIHKEDEFDELGGIGYNPLRPPHPECTECCGDGISRDVVKDTRHLSPAAAQLYAGVKRTKDGLQVLTHSKEAFAEKLWKHLGLYQKDNEQKTDPLASLLHALANGNGNGFKPVQDDPEAPSAPEATNTLQPRQEVDDGE